MTTLRCERCGHEVREGNVPCSRQICPYQVQKEKGETVSTSNPTASSLWLRRNGVLGKLLDGLLRPERLVHVGDALFEREFDVHVSEPATFAPAVLASADLRQRLLCVRRGTIITIAEARLSMHRTGIERKEAYLQFLLDLMCDLAGVIDSIGGGHDG